MSFSDNLREIRSRVEQVRASDQSIEIVAVTKGRGIEEIKDAYSAGIRIFAENKTQEAESKVAVFDTDVKWHMIGHLQTNKVKEAVRLFSMIQSVDSARVAEKIDKECKLVGKTMPVLLEVNISGEAQKYGFCEAEIKSALEEMKEFKNIHIEGFMGMASLTQDKAEQRKCFSLLRKIYEQYQGVHQDNAQIHILSMGMSDDFETAIQEGSNMIRIGRALFV